MDSLSVSKLNRLYWLGRYYERLSTTLSYLWDWYDVMIDGEIDYPDFCQKLSIDCCYKDDKDFMHNYVFDKNNPDSLRTVADAMLDPGLSGTGGDGDEERGGKRQSHAAAATGHRFYHGFPWQLR